MTDNAHVVELPGGGGRIPLQSRDEYDQWVRLEAAYREEYQFTKINDLTALSTLLVQHINLFRAQLGLSGRVPAVDEDGLPTGGYEQRPLKSSEIRSFQEQITQASKEIREIEKAIGVDKKSRESAGEENNRQWLIRMKARAHRYGLHVSRRVTAYEAFVMELRWRIRLNEIGDAEDKHYESCDDAGIIFWIRQQLKELEEADRKFAADEGALVVGRL